MDKQQIANLLQEQLDKIPYLNDLNPDDPNFQLWRDNGTTYFTELFPKEDRWLDSFSDWAYRVHVIKHYEDADYFSEEDKEAYLQGLRQAEVTLKAALKKLEIFGIKPQQASRETSQGVTIQIINNLSNKQTTQVMVSFEQIMQTVEEVQASQEDKQQASQYVKEIEEEIEKNNPSWDRVKTILAWLLNFSKDAFLQLLPYVIQAFVPHAQH